MTDERPPGRARRWRLLVRWTSIIVASAAVSVLFALLRVPSPALFGGLLTGVIFALTTKWRTVLPGPVNSGAQAVIGVVLGGLLELSILQSLGGDWLPVAAVIVGTLVLSVLAGLLMGRLTSVSPITGSLSLSAGGAAGITSMSRELGADERMVAVIQYLRVVLIVSTLPLVTTFVFQPPTGRCLRHHGPVRGRLGAGIDLHGGLRPGRLVARPLGEDACRHATRAAHSDRRADPGRLVIRRAPAGVVGAVGVRRDRAANRPGIHQGEPEIAPQGAAGCADPDHCDHPRLRRDGRVSGGRHRPEPTGRVPRDQSRRSFRRAAIAAETGAGTTFVLAVQVLRIFVMLLIAPGLAVLLSRLRDRSDPPE